jgi:hypothetical protein
MSEPGTQLTLDEQLIADQYEDEDTDNEETEDDSSS